VLERLDLLVAVEHFAAVSSFTAVGEDFDEEDGIDPRMVIAWRHLDVAADHAEIRVASESAPTARMRKLLS
jgi:hypothetical protein